MNRWNFPSNGHGEIKGIGDSGMETFRGTPLKSLAREICQNSLDADSKKGIVEVEFVKFELSPTELPGATELRKVLEKCFDFWKEQKSKVTKDFFSQATDKITSEKIQMLRISDFNTTGLKGSNAELNTDWTNLTKSSGVSDKGGTAGGSFGIGKFAPYSCSNFSTVFYSTYDIEEVKASQGVARLVTFREDNGETTQGIGYYGGEKNTPIYEIMDLDPNFSRIERGYGTDIYISGYKFSGDNWEEEIILSILDDFFVAIWNGKLIVRVGDIEISKETIAERFEEYKEKLTGYAYEYFNVLTDETMDWFETNFKNMGIVKLKIKLNTDMHRKVAMIRKTGMKIMDKGNISGYIPFSGVMLIEGEKLNSYLRRLENPQHTNWEYNRSDSPNKAKENLKDLYNYIKNCLDQILQKDSAEESDIEGIGQYLPDEFIEKGQEEKKETISNKINEINIDIKKRIDKREGNKKEDTNKMKKGISKPGGSIKGFPHNNGTGGNRGGREAVPVHFIDNIDGNEMLNIKEIGIEKKRLFCIDKNKGKYILSIIPKSSSDNGIIELLLSAEVGEYKAEILAASVVGGDKLEVFENKINGINLHKSKVIKINVQLDFSDYCSMEVNMYENKK